jgi:hypothetical protein
MVYKFSRMVVVSLLFIFIITHPGLSHADNGLSVIGSITDSNGKAIAEVTVALDYSPKEYLSHRSMRQVQTDGQGRFEFPHCKTGPAVLLVTADGFSPQEKKIIVGEQQNPVNFQLKPAATIRGRVVDEKGSPQAGVAVSVSSWHDIHSLYFRALTDEQGLFVWKNAPPDTVLFDFLAEEMMAERGYPLAPSNEDQEIILHPKLVIRGTVVDQDTGEAIQHFEVYKGNWIEAQKYIYFNKYVTMTIREGYYELPSSEPQPGNYVKIVANGYAPAISREFNSHEGLQTFDFKLTKSKAISGVVLLPDGKPAENATVALDIYDSFFSFRDGKISFDREPNCQTDSDGRFAFPAGTSFYNVIATHKLGYERISREEIEKAGTIRLKPWGRIEGTVWNGSEPAKNEKLWFHPAWYAHSGLSPEGGCLAFSYNVTTDDQGRFVIEPVCPGKATILHAANVAPGTNERSFTKHLALVEVLSGGITRLDIGRQGRTVVGRVDTGDRNIGWAANESGIIRMLDRRKCGECCIFLVQPDGIFQIDNLPAGEYSLTLNINPYPPNSYYSEVAPYCLPAQESNGCVKHIFTVPEDLNDKPLDIGKLKAYFPKLFQPGEPAPAIRLTTLDGGKFDLRDQQGKMVLLYFWNLPPYRYEIYGKADYGFSDSAWGLNPRKIRDIYERLRHHPKFVMLGLAVDKNENLLSDTMKNLRNSWPQAYLGGDSCAGLAADYGVQEFPTAFLVDPQGQIIDKYTSEENLEAALEEGLCFIDKERDSSNTVEWEFDGPLASNRNLIEKPYHNSWVCVDHITIEQRSYQNSSDASFGIYCSFAKDSPERDKSEDSYKLCLKVVMKAKDGREFLVAHRVQENKPTYHQFGNDITRYRPIIGGSYHLPVKLEDIVHVYVRVSRID